MRPHGRSVRPAGRRAVIRTCHSHGGVARRDNELGARILVIDDDPEALELSRTLLEHDGHEVLLASDGRTGLELARSENPDLIILDVIMPEIDGLEVLRLLRRESHVPVIMVTWRNEETDLVVGMEMGADDYLGKPISPAEFRTRVRALLRRAKEYAKPAGDQVTLEAGEIRIDLDRHSVAVGAREVDLTRTEFEILTFLVRNAGKVVSREALMVHIWGTAELEGRALDMHIARLRKKIEEDPSAPRHIQTVHAVGYRLEV